MAPAASRHTRCGVSRVVEAAAGPLYDWDGVAVAVMSDSPWGETGGAVAGPAERPARPRVPILYRSLEISALSRRVKTNTVVVGTKRTKHAQGTAAGVRHGAGAGRRAGAVLAPRVRGHLAVGADGGGGRDA